MAIISHPLLPMFGQFITDGAKGKRTKPNGEYIKPQTLKQYENTYILLIRFCGKHSFLWRVYDYQKLTKRERIAEANYWKKFERLFTNYLHTERQAHDNYTAYVFKQLKTFFHYLNKQRLIDTGPYFKLFKIIKQEIPVTALSRDNLLKLIYDKQFEESIPKNLQVSKDMFVFGCTCALRFSDLMLLKPLNLEQVNEEWYLKTQSKKTGAMQSVKLPAYAVDIAMKYHSPRNRFLFPRIALFNFNLHIKKIGVAMELTHLVSKSRSKMGLIKADRQAEVPFFQTMSSHLMRRTAITNMLTLGMPENLVKHISGHAGDSKSFHRYVAYSQTYMNGELDKVYEKMKLFN